MKNLLTGFLILLIIGCQSRKQSNEPLIKREQSSPADYVRFLDPDLEDKIKVVSVFKYIDGGLLGFQVNVRLEEGPPMWIEYQTVFYSEEGQEIESRFWRPHLLITKQDTGLSGIATYPTSKKFIVYIRTYTGKPTPVR
jgi:uncharacterized protein YcfL